MAEAAGALYGVETLIEGAVAAAKGIYDPTLPLKAKLVPLNDVTLARSQHTISIVKGRAYIFGGKTSSEDGTEVRVFQTRCERSSDHSRSWQTMTCTCSF